jgi:hypothetical protein
MKPPMIRNSALPSALLALALPFAAEAQAVTLRGRVVDQDRVPVPNAEIAVTSVGYTVRADSQGYFALSGQPGAILHLSLRAPRYRGDTASVVLARGKALQREFTLESEDAPRPEANPGDRTLRGRITDTDGAPLSFANIQLNGGTRFIADDSGRFTIPIGSQRLWLLVRRIGFDPAELRLESMPDTAVRISMTPLATALPETRVIGRAAIVSLDLHGFYQRMRDVERGANRGHFITPEELELRRPNNLTSAVQYVPTVRIRPIPGTIPVWQNMRVEDSNKCPMTVYMDRMRIQPTTRGGRRVDEQVNLLALPTHIAGIEVYPRSLGAPPEYRPVEGTCGVVLVWTK